MGHSSTGSGAQRERHAHLLRLVYGGQVAQTIYVAAKLALPDLLAAGTRTTSELATATTIEEPTLRRVLRGLIALGLCCEVEPERYMLSELGQFLRSDHPRSLRARTLFLNHVGDQRYRVCGRMSIASSSESSNDRFASTMETTAIGREPPVRLWAVVDPDV